LFCVGGLIDAKQNATSKTKTLTNARKTYEIEQNQLKHFKSMVFDKNIIRKVEKINDSDAFSNQKWFESKKRKNSKQFFLNNGTRQII
jgi:hypothetical protein